MADYILERNPINASFELTVRCNLRCKMCLFRHDEAENNDLKVNELSTKQWIDFARQAAEMGIGGILFTGGEPLLRDDFPEIYEGVYQYGFIISLYTNATLVTPEIMNLFRKYPPHKIGISIYGATPETYKTVCGSSSAFQKAIDGSRSLLTLPSVIEFRSTIIKDNLHESRAIEELVKDEFGEKYPVSLSRMVMKSVRGACSDVESCRLSPEDNVRLMLQKSIDTLKNKIGKNFDEKNIRIHYGINKSKTDCFSPRSKASLLGCGGGTDSFAVTWDGKLQACQLLGAFQTDAVKHGLKKAWEIFPLEIKLPPFDSKCQNCSLGEICQCCFASRYAETGSLSGCPEYACRDSEIIDSLIFKESKTS